MHGKCRARGELEEERLARIDAEDIVSKLQEQLAEVQSAEVTARQAAETRLSSLTQEYESMKEKVSKVKHSGVVCVCAFRCCLCLCFQVLFVSVRCSEPIFCLFSWLCLVDVSVFSVSATSLLACSRQSCK